MIPKSASNTPASITHSSVNRTSPQNPANLDRLANPAQSASLTRFGWSEEQGSLFLSHAARGFEPGRVILSSRGHSVILTESGEVEAETAGLLRHRAEGGGDLPVVGDWVALERITDSDSAIVRAVLPRHTFLSRRGAGRGTREQIVAANVDLAFLVMGLDGDFNLRRLERFLVMVLDGGVKPVVVLSKTDLCDGLEGRCQAVAAVAPDVPVVPISSLRGQGLEELRALLEPGLTATLLGSSGVGKTTLINRLLGRDLLTTGAVRERDDRGRHTTTHRHLLALPDGGLMIDNPGIRELQPWASDEGLDAVFDDVRAVATRCRFRDCTHLDEPGCAVRESVENGSLDVDRLHSLQKLEREQRSLEIRKDRAARKAAGKKAQTMYRSAKKAKARRKTW